METVGSDTSQMKFLSSTSIEEEKIEFFLSRWSEINLSCVRLFQFFTLYTFGQTNAEHTDPLLLSSIAARADWLAGWSMLLLHLQHASEMFTRLRRCVNCVDGKFTICWSSSFWVVGYDVSDIFGWKSKAMKWMLHFVSHARPFPRTNSYTQEPEEKSERYCKTRRKSERNSKSESQIHWVNICSHTTVASSSLIDISTRRYDA